MFTAGTLWRTILAGNSGANIRVPVERYQVQKAKARAAIAATVRETMMVADDQGYAPAPPSWSAKTRRTEAAMMSRHLIISS